MQFLLAFNVEREFKNMKKASKIMVLIAAALLSVGITVRAAQIGGEITFTGSVFARWSFNTLQHFEITLRDAHPAVRKIVRARRPNRRAGHRFLKATET